MRFCALRIGPRAWGVMMLDLEALRAEFPCLQQRVHGQPLAYLDNAATTQRPQAVIDAIARFYAEDNANVHRGVHQLAERATFAYEAARARVAEWLGAASAREIVFVRGTTEAINLVAASWGVQNLQAGDEVLITEMEHHANIVPWRMLCDRVGARLVVAPITDRGEIDLDAFRSRLSARTKLVAFAHVSNALGTVNPVAELVAEAKKVGACVLVDGAQALAHLPIDVRALGCDFYAVSAHKAYGPFGIGALWAREELLAEMPPYQGGGEMIRVVEWERIEYAEHPHRFEAGTPNVAGAIGFAAALDWIERWGLARLHAHEEELMAYALARLAEVPHLRLIGTPRQRVGAISFVIDGVHAHDLGTILDHHGVAIRAGHHCAMPLMRRFGVPATARASLACYNAKEEVDALIEALKAAISMLA